MNRSVPHVSREQIHSKIQQVLSGIINPNAQTTVYGEHFMERWDWYQGVALWGMYQYARLNNDNAVRDYIIHWFDHHIEKGLPEKNINTMLPCLTLSYLYEELNNEQYGNICKEWLDYAMHQLPKTVEGGFQHTTADSDNYMQLWDDTLYMTVLFITRMGTLLHRDDCIQESIRQFLVHMKYLTDMKTGLFFHGWTFDGCHHFAEARWGRGNAWYTAGLVDYLELADIPDGIRMVLLSAMERQADALQKYQDAEGMWHTLVDQPDTSYAESSATAGFSYGLLKAVRLGYLPHRYLETALRGAQAILARLDEDGILQEVSGGTCLSYDLDYYRSRPLDAQPYGQAMALLMLMELKEMLNDMPCNGNTEQNRN